MCRAISILVATTLLMTTGCRVTDWTLWQPAPARADGCEVVRLRDVSYYDGADADAHRHTLDLYLPRGKRDFPVVVFVHGGAWMMGDNRCCGLQSSVGEFLASQGIGAVLPNYRLSPNVKHPEHAKDIARAVAWTKTHIGNHGGDPSQLFLMGHSAGGHLVALLATDSRYLNNEGMSVAHLRGVIAVSGVYRIPPGTTGVELGGNTELGLRLDEFAPIRGFSTAFDHKAPEKGGLPVRVNVFGPAFGDDAEVRQAASPLTHVRRALPPFLLLSAEKDLPLLPAMAQDFHHTLLRHGCESTLLTVQNRNHNSIIFQAIEPNDPAARAIVAFIHEHQ
jgi:acetyl esterase/lipase